MSETQMKIVVHSGSTIHAGCLDIKLLIAIYCQGLSLIQLEELNQLLITAISTYNITIIVVIFLFNIIGQLKSIEIYFIQNNLLYKVQ